MAKHATLRKTETTCEFPDCWETKVMGVSHKTGSPHQSRFCREHDRIRRKVGNVLPRFLTRNFDDDEIWMIRNVNYDVLKPELSRERKAKKVTS